MTSLQSLQDTYTTLQSQLSELVATRQKLQAQQSENESVQKEFASLNDDANIYKLLGPVLLKQEKNEANLAVSGRLEFIGGEIKRVDGNIQEMQEKSNKLRNDIYQKQVEEQQQQEQEGQEQATAS